MIANVHLRAGRHLRGSMPAWPSSCPRGCKDYVGPVHLRDRGVSALTLYSATIWNTMQKNFYLEGIRPNYFGLIIVRLKTCTRNQLKQKEVISMRYIYIILIVVAVTIVLLFVFQNTLSTTVSFFSASVTLPLSILVQRCVSSYRN
jgi:uncharacterized integral membrane protein